MKLTTLPLLTEHDLVHMGAFPGLGAVQRARRDGTGPDYMDSGNGQILYLTSVVMEWLETSINLWSVYDDAA